MIYLENMSSRDRAVCSKWDFEQVKNPRCACLKDSGVINPFWLGLGSPCRKLGKLAILKATGNQQKRREYSSFVAATGYGLRLSGST